MSHCTKIWLESRRTVQTFQFNCCKYTRLILVAAFSTALVSPLLLATSITPRATAVGLKDTLSGRPDPIQGRPSLPFAMSSFTRTFGLLLSTNHVSRDKTITSYPLYRPLNTTDIRHVLGRPIADRKRDDTAIVVCVSSLYWPAQAWLDGNRHQHQMAPATFCPRTRELAACEPRALPRPVPGKPISLWTLIWICAAPPLLTSGRERFYWFCDNLRNHQRPFGTYDREIDGPLIRPAPHEPSALPWS